jgi:hypothetical protein
MRRRIAILAALLAATALAGCEKKDKPALETRTVQRADFAPEEFGIGRPHTRSAACNREIDKLLDQIRVCINTRPAAECKTMQDKNNDRIGQIKNQRRCSR